MTTTSGLAAPGPDIARPSTARPTPPRTWPRRAAVLVVLAAITAWSWFAVDADVSAIVHNFRNATTTIAQLVQPDYSFFPETVDPLLETVQMAVIGTAIGVVLAVPISFLASRATNPRSRLRAGVRFVMDAVRAVPDLLYASIFVTVVGTGAVSGILALVLFNVGILVKLVSEALDGADRGGQEAALAAGATWVQADRAAMLPQVGTHVVSQTIYVLELNVRASTVIGLVGAGGLGMLIDRVRTFYQYHYLSLVILEILVLVLALEILSATARRRLVR